MNRRTFLSTAGAVLADPFVSSMLPAQVKKRGAAATQHGAQTEGARADHTLSIEPCSIEISPGITIKTVGYNGQVPGALLRLAEGRPVTIDVLNRTPNATLCTGMGWRSIR